MRSHLAEGRSRAQAVLDMPGWDAASRLDRVHALEAAGGLAYWAGDVAASNRHYTEAVAVARTTGDDRELANALYNNFFSTRSSGGVDAWRASLTVEGKPFLDEALAIWERLGDEDGVARANWGLAEHYGYRGEVGAAIEAATRALTWFERSGSSFWIAWARFTRGFAHSVAGDLRPASIDLAVALREFLATRDVSGVALLLSAGSSVLLMASRPRNGYAVAAASHRAVSETGFHLAGLWPGETFPTADLDTTNPALRAAIAEGERWTREDAAARVLTAFDGIAAGTLGPEPDA